MTLTLRLHFQSNCIAIWSAALIVFLAYKGRCDLSARQRLPSVVATVMQQQCCWSLKCLAACCWPFMAAQWVTITKDPNFWCTAYIDALCVLCLSTCRPECLQSFWYLLLFLVKLTQTNVAVPSIWPCNKYFHLWLLPGHAQRLAVAASHCNRSLPKHPTAYTITTICSLLSLIPVTTACST